MAHPFVKLLHLKKLIRTRSIKKALFAKAINNCDQQEFTILTKLHDHGIKEYMSKHYNENQCDDIDSVYRLSQQYFGKQLAKITSLHHRKDDQSATAKKTRKEKEKEKNISCRFWSCKDIVMKTFQYLNVLSLNACSLVCINFLSHSYNPSSIYRLILNDETKSNAQHICLSAANAMRSRDWKRFGNCKHLELGMWKHQEYDLTFSKTFINGLLSLRYIEIFDFGVLKYAPGVVLFVKKLSKSNCMVNGIKKFTFCAQSKADERDKLYNCRVKLMNCETCVLSNVGFKVILSNKCQHLTLNENILDKNFDYSENSKRSVSDLSNIKTLTLYETNFGESKMSENWWNSLCSQFININQLKICGDMTKHTLLFWQGLMQRIIANQGRVFLNVADLSIMHTLSNDEIGKLITHDICIHLGSNLEFLDDTSWSVIKNIKKLLKHASIYQNVNSLTLKVWSNTNDILNAFFHILKMDEETNYTKPLTRQLAPHQVFSKLVTRKDFEKQGVFPGNCNQWAVGWRVEHGNISFKNNTDAYSGDRRSCSDSGNAANSEKNEAIVKVHALIVNSNGRVFLHYEHMKKYFGTESNGGWHNLPNDNLYPASFVGSKYRLINDLNVDWPYWYNNALKLNCICVKTGTTNKKTTLSSLTMPTLDNIVLFMIDINENKMSKQKDTTIDGVNRIGLDISGYCNIDDDKKITTNVFENIKKLILLSIPIRLNFNIVGKEKEQELEIKHKQWLQELFNSVFDDINEWYKTPVCNDKFWNVLDKPKITFTCCRVKMCGKIQQGVCVLVQTAQQLSSTHSDV